MVKLDLLIRLRQSGRAEHGTHRTLFAVTALAVVAADQAGKAWAVVAARRGGPGPLGAELVQNTGAAFGLGRQWTVVISLVTLAAVVALTVAGLRSRHGGSVFALALMAGGALGNGADRLLRAPGALHGAVVDWIEVPGYGPTFNLADVAVRTGALLFIVLLVRYGRENAGPAGEPRRERKAAAGRRRRRSRTGKADPGGAVETRRNKECGGRDGGFPAREEAVAGRRRRGGEGS